ncbi:RagB/SusD family nutrient uptake outer membrane protein [Chitinophaga parva]|uniref:RagB/SusD family nutrient uptake outer membrane protein n=1 Tax=Chitinophaga parva TaxID=2169414 RepID=UPI001F0C8F1E|nr:RagB/SusD family nutrient uptake outer membrane protein [Chitinophaga parva]
MATIDYAFRQRSTAEQYLFTCYSYMPKHGDVLSNPAFLAGDEMWFYYPYAVRGFTLDMSSHEIARGNQSVTAPLVSYWDGTNGARSLFAGIRDCNIFLENINSVPGMEQYEKDQWAAEAVFLKAYYHYWLLRLYGPIPIVDKNLPINATQDQVQVERQTVDSCFNYVVHTLDGAIMNLPDQIQDAATQAGRITKTIAKAVKAEVLVTAASPLFNGNTSYTSFKSKSGVPFFNAAIDPQKWVKAMNACREAIELATSQGYRLNHFNPALAVNLPVDLQVEMDVRTAVTDNFNPEVIWANTNSLASLIQSMAQPRINATNAANVSPWSISSVPLNIVNTFYSKNGVPVNQDKTLDFITRGAQTRVATSADMYHIQPNYTSAAINFDREPRFYADLGFDGSILFGNGNQTLTALNHLEARQGQYAGWSGDPSHYNITGYWPVKLVNYLNTFPTTTTYSSTSYAWPVMRLADLYLMYAETINEVSGPVPDAFRWIDSVRARAGIPSVQDAWTNYANNPGAFASQAGLRQIIHQEREIEFAFEGQRFWDLRRWKEADKTWQEPIQGWNIGQSDIAAYYQMTTLYNRTFQLRDYFWPIAESDLLVNKNLVQNPGW